MRGRSVLAAPALAAALSALLWMASARAAPTFPAPAGYMNDFAGILTPPERDRLETELRDYDRRTGTQIAVAIFPDLRGVPLNDFAARLEEAWKVGRRGKDNGVLLLVATKERQVRIEVGYGLEGKITDADAGGIIRNIIAPAFREGRYADGIEGAVSALMRLIGTTGSSAPPAPVRPATPGWLPFGIFAGFILLMSLISRASGRRCPRCRARMQPQAAQTVGNQRVVTWVCPRCGYRERVVQQGGWMPAPMAYGGWGSGGFSGGGGGSSGGGGFGGFGGGSSGGGGASGGW